MGVGKWVGAAIGWALGGPIGALIGFSLGSWIGGSVDVDRQIGSGDRRRFRQQTTPYDFKAALLVLTAGVMKADGRVLKSELAYVKAFLINNFGEAQTKRDLLLLRDLLKRDIPVQEVAGQIRRNMRQPAKLQLLYYLVGLAKADNELHAREERLIHQIAIGMGLSEYDIRSVFATREPESRESNYEILEIDRSTTDEGVKKAYRKMARKYHPDKVSNLGPEAVESAEEKFKRMKQAYEAIKKERGMR
jgi:DnaJ like chaperone protein